MKISPPILPGSYDSVVLKIIDTPSSPFLWLGNSVIFTFPDISRWGCSFVVGHSPWLLYILSSSPALKIHSVSIWRDGVGVNNFISCVVLLVLGLEPIASCMPNTHSTLVIFTPSTAFFPAEVHNGLGPKFCLAEFNHPTWGGSGACVGQDAMVLYPASPNLLLLLFSRESHSVSRLAL